MTDFLRILPAKGFDYVNTGNPTVSVNPPVALVTWLNATNGNIFICTNNTPGANVWKLASGFRGALGRRLAASGNQTIAAAGSASMIMTGVVYDTDSFINVGGANPERITIPAGVSKVKLSANVYTGPNTSQIDILIRFIIYKNGASASGLPYIVLTKAKNDWQVYNISSAVVDVVAGDYFTALLTNGASTDSITIVGNDALTWFSIEVVE